MYASRRLSLAAVGKAAHLDDFRARYATRAEDVARAARFRLERGEEGIFHCSSPEPVTMYAFTCRAAALLGLDSSHLRPLEEAPPLPEGMDRRPPTPQLDPGKIHCRGFPGFQGYGEALPAMLEGMDPQIFLKVT